MILLTQIILVLLKIYNVISWSWWVVFIPFESIAILFLLYIVLDLIYNIID